MCVCHLYVRVEVLIQYAHIFYFSSRRTIGRDRDEPIRWERVRRGKNLNAKFEVAAEEKKKEEETPNDAKKSQRHLVKKVPKQVPDSFMVRLAKTFGILRNKASVVVVGLDNSGKTTLLNYLKPDHGMMLKEVTPTIGFTLEKFRRGKLDFTCFDMSGQGKYRSLWEKHYENCDAIIWVSMPRIP